jgi:hypothetical protein
MVGTSRVRRRLTVVEPNPDRHELQEPPAVSSEVPQPDSADQVDLDAVSTGMSTLLRMALRLMKSYGTGRR